MPDGFKKDCLMFCILVTDIERYCQVLQTEEKQSYLQDLRSGESFWCDNKNILILQRWWLEDWAAYYQKKADLFERMLNA